MTCWLPSVSVTMAAEKVVWVAAGDLQDLFDEYELQYVKEHGYCTTNYESIMGKGRIRILGDDEKMHALKQMMAHYHGDRETPFNPAALPRTCVFALDVEQITGKRKEAKKFD